MNFLKSPYIAKGNTVNFLDDDSEELYANNLKSKPINWKYRHNNFSYELNSNSYRTKEFSKIDWNNSIVIFGCSITFGLGVSEEDTISSQLYKLSGIPTVNMGFPGSSSQLSLYNSAILKENGITPKAIVFEWSHASRCTLFMNPPHTKNDFFVINCGDWNNDISGLGKAWSKYESNINMHIKMTRLIAKNLWSSTQYTDFTLFKANKKYINDCKYIDQIDNGRDCSHPGELTYKNCAIYIAQSLKL